MARYLLIESRDPFETASVGAYYDLAAALARGGDEVSLFLVQNGVLPTRRHSRAEDLAAVIGAGVEVVADEFSLRERGIDSAALVPGVRSVPIDFVIDRLAEGRKALWH